MGLADTFGKEDRVEVKFSDFYEMVKGCTQAEMMANGLRKKIPHAHILAVVDHNFNGFDEGDDTKDHA